jgi:hypothetical protein
LQLEQQLNMTITREMFFENATFRQQVDYLSTVDILISPHGAQLTGLFTMPYCSGLLEIFPDRYVLPAYFGSLALISGVNHGYLHCGDGDSDGVNETKNHWIRAEFMTNRRAKVSPPAQDVVDAVKVLLDDWKDCCSEGSPSIGL